MADVLFYRLPAGMRTRYLKTLRPDCELLFGLNCMPASGTDGLFLWRPSLQRKAQMFAEPETVLAVDPFTLDCLVQGALELLIIGSVAWQVGKLYIKTLEEGEVKSYPVVDYVTGDPIYATFSKVSFRRINAKLFLICSNSRPPLVAELWKSAGVAKCYTVGSLIQTLHLEKISVDAKITSTSGNFPLISGIKAKGNYINSLSFFLNQIQLDLQIGPNNSSNKYEFWLEWRRASDGAVIAESNHFTSLPSYNRDQKTPLTFTFMRHAPLGSPTGSETYELHIVWTNYDTNNSLGFSLGVCGASGAGINYSDLKGVLSPAIQVADSVYLYLINLGLPPIVGYIYDPEEPSGFKQTPEPIGSASRNFLCLPTGKQTVVFGDAITLDFENEVNVGGVIKELVGSEAGLFISTDTSVVYIQNPVNPVPTELIPSRVDRVLPVATGIVFILGGRIVRLFSSESNAIEIPFPLHLPLPSSSFYESQSGALLFGWKGLDLMAVYFEGYGQWLLWRFDEAGGKKVLGVADGRVLFEDGSLWEFSWESEEQPYEVGLLALTSLLPERAVLRCSGVELEGRVYSEGNLLVGGLLRRSFLFALETGVPLRDWTKELPMSAFRAGEFPSVAIGTLSDPVEQIYRFSGVRAEDIGGEAGETVTVEGRRFLVALWIGADERKWRDSLLEGFYLHGYVQRRK